MIILFIRIFTPQKISNFQRINKESFSDKTIETSTLVGKILKIFGLTKLHYWFRPGIKKGKMRRNKGEIWHRWEGD